MWCHARSSIRIGATVLVCAGTFAGCVRWSPPAMAPAASGLCRSASLRWFTPDDQAERRRLDSWCAGVGTPAVQPSAADGRPTSIDIKDVTFVSWNVHVGNGDIRAFVRDLRYGSLTAGRTVGDFVLLLQEAVRTSDVPPLAEEASGAARIPAKSAANDIVRVSAELGLSLIYVPSMRNGSSLEDPAEDRGSAILSTLPLSEPTAVELPGERQRRVAIFAKIPSLSVGVMHFDALGGARRLWVFWTPWMRSVQEQSVRPLLPDGPFVLGADLNTWHGIDEPAPRGLQQLPRATPVSLERHGLGTRVLDYLFFRAGEHHRAHYRQLSNLYGSDHRPLIGWVE